MNWFHDDGFGPIIPKRFLGCHGGGSSSQSSNTASQSNPVVNPQIFNLLNQNVNRATSVADRPFQSYDAPQVAGLTGAQQQAGSLLTNGAMSAGAGALNAGVNATQAGTGDILAGISKYQNPYTSQVVDASLGDINRQREMAINQGGADATQAGAFGGSRHGVADSLTNEAALRQSGLIGSQLRSQGFDTAAGLAGADANRNVQAGSVLGQLGNSQAGNYLNAANAINAYGGQEQQTNQSMLTSAFNEFMRQQNYPVEMQQLISQAMGLVPGAGGNAATSTSRGSGSSFQFSL